MVIKNSWDQVGQWRRLLKIGGNRWLQQPARKVVDTHVKPADELVYWALDPKCSLALSGTIKRCMRETLVGFRPGSDFINQIFTWPQILERRYMFHTLTISVFPDLKATFNFVDRAFLWCTGRCAREICSTYPTSVCKHSRSSSCLRWCFTQVHQWEVVLGRTNSFVFISLLSMRWLWR